MPPPMPPLSGAWANAKDPVQRSAARETANDCPNFILTLLLLVQVIQAAPLTVCDANPGGNRHPSGPVPKRSRRRPARQHGAERNTSGLGPEADPIPIPDAVELPPRLSGGPVRLARAAVRRAWCAPPFQFFFAQIDQFKRSCSAIRT